MNNLKLVILYLSLGLFFTCSNVLKEERSSQEAETEQNKEKNAYKEPIDFIDEESGVEVSVHYSNMRISLSGSLSPEESLEVLDKLLNRFSNTDYSQAVLTLSIWITGNRGLLNSLQEVPEINQNITKNINEGNLWVDFIIVSQFATKSSELKKIIDLLKTYDLVFDKPILEKCGHRENEYNEVELWCPMIFFPQKK